MFMLGANIKAKIWHSKKEKVELNQKIKIPTGATEVKYKIFINNFQINFYKTLSKFQNYDTISEEKKILLFSNFYLPIKIEKITNSEFQYEAVTYTEEEITKITESKLQEEIMQEIENKDNIVSSKTNTKRDEQGFLEVEVIYEVLENIGNEEKIIF